MKGERGKVRKEGKRERCRRYYSARHITVAHGGCCCWAGKRRATQPHLLSANKWRKVIERKELAKELK